MPTTPSEGRRLYRNGQDFKVPTALGQYPGFLLTNVSILPSEFSNAFEEFCRLNSAPCPLVYKSKAGEVEAPLLSQNSDIRSDISTYVKYVHGKSSDEPLKDLREEPWGNMTSFYLGCSYSFDDKLSESGIKLDYSRLGMYQTNIKCVSSGPFQCNMVVSMRPIEKHQLDTAVTLTINMEFAHGAPIHIGYPADIGLNGDNLKTDFGEEVTISLAAGEVPCFWACGVTGNEAVASAKLPVAYSHYPGCMYITDVKTKDAPDLFKTVGYPTAIVICTNEILSRYVSVSVKAWDVMSETARIVSEDPGNRNIGDLVVQGDFGKACLDLSMRATSVAILTGFPIFPTDPPEENDGVAGAIYIARALQAVGARVTFLVDSTAKVLMNVFKESAAKGFLHDTPVVIAVGKGLDGVPLYGPEGTPIYSHFVAIERPCPAADGRAYTMSARDITDNLGAMNELFRQAFHSPDITTIGIGDGGNEVGMGKVKNLVESKIKFGEIIAADIPADFLMTCGVSNWGGLAIGAGLFSARQCPVHGRYHRRGLGLKKKIQLTDFLVSPEQDLALHVWLTERGFSDGVTGRNELTIDGVDYHKFHAPVLKRLISIVD